MLPVVGSQNGAVAQAQKPQVAKEPQDVSLLTYQFKPGEKAYFRVSALFDGHFPPFAQPDSPPVHFKAILGYTMTVLKSDAQGATVEFTVNGKEMYLFKNEVAEDAKIDLNSEDIAPLDGLTSLEDTQKALNATAILRPDGSVAKILSTSSVKVPFDVGFDIRKLFLMMLPVTFPDRAIKAGDTWVATDGLLGSKAGKTEYSDKLETVTPTPSGRLYKVSQTAKSVVEDKLDKTGASTTNEAEVYRLLDGKVSLKTDATFLVPSTLPSAKTPSAKPNGPLVGGGLAIHGVQVKSVHLEMNAAINRKRIKIDPNQPEIPENDPMDVRARMTISRMEGPLGAANPGAATGKASADTKPGKTVGNPKDAKNTGKSGGKTAGTGKK